MLSEGLLQNNVKTFFVNWNDLIRVSKYVKRKGTRLLPFLKQRIDNHYFLMLNYKYIQLYESFFKPEIIFIYNNEFILPETIRYFKKHSKIVFILADNPLYSNTFDYNLQLLEYADTILVPDSFWKVQLSRMGYKNIMHGFLGYDKRQNFKMSPSDENLLKYSSDLVYIGYNHNYSWGYKKCRFLNSFCDFNFKIYGNGEGWNKWITYFPNLGGKIVYQQKRYSQETVNIILNCCKIYPIDTNPGIFNGIHLRFFECIGSEILPIIECTEDLKVLKKDINIPSFRDYRQAQKLVRYYLKHDTGRNDLIRELKTYIDMNYSPSILLKAILNKL